MKALKVKQKAFFIIFKGFHWPKIVSKSAEVSAIKIIKILLMIYAERFKSLRLIVIALKLPTYIFFCISVKNTSLFNFAGLQMPKYNHSSSLNRSMKFFEVSLCFKIKMESAPKCYF